MCVRERGEREERVRERRQSVRELGLAETASTCRLSLMLGYTGGRACSDRACSGRACRGLQLQGLQLQVLCSRKTLSSLFPLPCALPVTRAPSDVRLPRSHSSPFDELEVTGINQQ